MESTASRGNWQRNADDASLLRLTACKEGDTGVKALKVELFVGELDSSANFDFDGGWCARLVLLGLMQGPVGVDLDLCSSR